MIEIALALVSIALFFCISMMVYRSKEDANQREHERLLNDWNNRDQTLYGLQVKLFEGGTFFIEVHSGIKDTSSIFNNIYYYQQKDLETYDSNMRYKNYKVYNSKDLAFEKLDHIHRTQSDVKSKTKVYMRSNIVTIDIEAKESTEKVA